MGHIFFSYSRKDSETVDRIVTRLKNDGFNVWIDREGIKGGDLWREAIVEAVDTAYSVVIMLSPHSIASDNVRKEVDLADGAGKSFIPLLLKLLKLPARLRYQLAGLQWIEYFQDPETKYAELVQVLQSHRQKAVPIEEMQTREAEIVIGKIKLSKFGAEQQEKLLNYLSQLTETPRSELQITSINPGSVHVMVRMPARAAYRLKTYALNRLPSLIEFGIEAVRLSGDKHYVLLESGGIGPINPGSSPLPGLIISLIVIGIAIVGLAWFTGFPPIFPASTDTPRPTGTLTPSRVPTDTPRPPTITPSLTQSLVPTDTPTITPSITPTLTPPDLVVTSVEITGSPEIDFNNRILLPVEVVVRNQGETAADIFKVAATYTVSNQTFVVAFHENEQDDGWYPYTNSPLQPGDEVTFTGILDFHQSAGGQTIQINATADSCSGEEFTPEYCHVQESNENNNTSSPTQFSMPTVLYDFVDNAYLADWSGNNGNLPFPGVVSDSDGFAIWQDFASLEDFSSFDRVLETHPTWVNNGLILGEYNVGGIVLEEGDRFVAHVGFMNGAGAGNVTFKFVIAKTSGCFEFDCFVTFSKTKAYNGSIDPWTFYLPEEVLGQPIDYMWLRVDAGSSSAQDWAVWVVSRLERP